MSSPKILYGSVTLQSIGPSHCSTPVELGDDMLFAVPDVANEHFSDDADTVVAQTESLSLEDGTLVLDLVCQVRILAYRGRDGDYLASRSASEIRHRDRGRGRVVSYGQCLFFGGVGR